MAQSYRKDDENKNMNGRVTMNFAVRANVAFEVDQICDSLQIDRSKFFKSLITFVVSNENPEELVTQIYNAHVQIKQERKEKVSRKSKPVVYVPVEVSEEEEEVEEVKVYVLSDGTIRRGRGRPKGSKNKPKLILTQAANVESDVSIEE